MLSQLCQAVATGYHSETYKLVCPLLCQTDGEFFYYSGPLQVSVACQSTYDDDSELHTVRRVHWSYSGTGVGSRAELWTEVGKKGLDIAQNLPWWPHSLSSFLSVAHSFSPWIFKLHLFGFNFLVEAGIELNQRGLFSWQWKVRELVAGMEGSRFCIFPSPRDQHATMLCTLETLAATGMGMRRNAKVLWSFSLWE